jgi:hypothetical protein
VIQDLERALLQAPAMHLRDAAAATDWDAALAALDDEDGNDVEEDAAAARTSDGGGDDEITLFRTHHAALHEAARAVLHVSDGRIRRLV